MEFGGRRDDEHPDIFDQSWENDEDAEEGGKEGQGRAT